MSFTEFTYSFLPVAFLVLLVIFSLIFFLISIFDESLLYNSWNILYMIDNVHSMNVFVVRLGFFNRKTTVDVSKTNVTIQLCEVGNYQKTTIKIPSKFFDPNNEHNQYHTDCAVIKFLLICDHDFQSINKMCITHDAPGELHVSVLGIQNATSNDGFLSCIERCIKSVPVSEMDKEQKFLATPQSNLELEGVFAISNGIHLFEYIGPIFMLLSIVAYKCSPPLVYYFTNIETQPDFPMFHSKNSIHNAVIFSVSHFFLIIGLLAIIYSLTKYNLCGKPYYKFSKLLYFYSAVCFLVGIIFVIMAAYALEPRFLQFVLDDSSHLYNFYWYWMIGMITSLVMVLFFCLPFFAIYLIFITMIFKQYKTK